MEPTLSDVRWFVLSTCLLMAACSGTTDDEVTDDVSNDDDTQDTDTDDTDVSEPTDVLIPAGTFTMGATGEEREITLTRGFYIQTTEVSQADWDALVPDNPSGTNQPDHPVENVSWYDALFYANQLSAHEGLTECFNLDECSGTPGVIGFGVAYLCPDAFTLNLDCDGYRLPTEAEWEYAAGLGLSVEPTCDDDADPDVINCGGDGYTTSPVESGTPNSLGLYGMQSNVGEWAWDWLDNYGGTTTDPIGPSSGSNRTSRGGGWRFNYYQCAITHRSSDSPSCQNDSLGIRLVRTAP